MITQVYLYFATFKRDPLWIRIFVLVLFLADTVNVAFMWTYMYDSLVLHFNDAEFLRHANWVFSTDPAMVSIISSMVQCFFAFRVRTLRRSIWPALVIVVLALASLIGGLATAVAVKFVPTFEEFQKFKIPVTIWLVAAALCDIVITSLLVDFLMKHKTGFEKTDTKLDRLMKLIIQTGMATCICAVIDCILFLVDPTGLHLIFNLPLANLYSNALMSTLNARIAWTVRPPPVSSSGPASSARPELVAADEGAPYYGQPRPGSNVLNKFTSSKYGAGAIELPNMMTPSKQPGLMRQGAPITLAGDSETKSRSASLDKEPPYMELSDAATR